MAKMHYTCKYAGILNACEKQEKAAPGRGLPRSLHLQGIYKGIHFLLGAYAMGFVDQALPFCMRERIKICGGILVLKQSHSEPHWQL